MKKIVIYFDIFYLLEESLKLESVKSNAKVSKKGIIKVYSVTKRK